MSDPIATCDCGRSYTRDTFAAHPSYRRTWTGLHLRQCDCGEWTLSWLETERVTVPEQLPLWGTA